VKGIAARFALDRPGFSLDVDVHLPGQGITAVFGPSGSGKTTLLRCIAGLERAGHGRLVVEGETWQDGNRWVPAHRRPIGYVFQDASLFPHLSVIGNLRYGMKRSHAARHVDLEHAIELLGIGHLLDRRPAGLSGGERQRVGIARALAVGPRLLLMDEPLSALDHRRRQEILPYLERLHAELDIPVVYVSHAPDEVARLADHLVVMEGGRVQASGPLSQTLTALDSRVCLGGEACVILEGTVAEIDTDWHLARVSIPGGSLWARDQGLSAGRRVRVRVLARDVSLAEQPGASSIHNLLHGAVDEVGDDEHPGLSLVRMRVGESLLLARMTKRAAALMGVKPGKAFWVQVKSVVLLQ
jgi:molybdate transport system ATP-binding protein